MTSNPMPFVAIVGGLRTLKDDPVAAEAARTTARQLGAALANAGMGLVVYLSDDESLEPHVVSGYVKALAAETGAQSIRVRFAESQKKTVAFAEQKTRSELFDRKLFTGQDWEAPFYRSLAAADGVDALLLLAGARSTLIAGQIAIARKLPILAIEKYDGAAAVIRSELAATTKDYPSLTTHTEAELVAWLKTMCLARAEQQRQARLRESNYVKAASQKEKALLAGCAFAVLLCSLFFGVAQPPSPKVYSFLTFIGWIAAGATGAVVRSVIWGAEETESVTSLVLGGIAGFVVGLAYLIPQWVTAHGVLEPGATVVAATDKIQFISSILVAISAGVGFDTVFTRLKKDAADRPVGPGAAKL